MVSVGIGESWPGIRGSPIAMRRVDYDEYLEFARKTEEVEIEGSRIKLEPIQVKRIHPSVGELTNIDTTVWSFPKRGAWATHRGDYRGNWPPQMARALILMYTRPGDTVLDPMVGSGTTCIEAKLLGRNCIGVDINYSSVLLTLHRLYWLEKWLEDAPRRSLHGLLGAKNMVDEATVEDVIKARVEVYHGDARNLDKIGEDSIDLIATHPPYSNIIRYSAKSSMPGDLSSAKTLEEYIEMMRTVASEAFRTLKPAGHMGILVGDTRIHKHYVPITHYVLQVLLKTGFILREEVVKIQHKMKATREIWRRIRNRDFLLIYHEKLYILRKPRGRDEYRKYRYSSYMETR
ncbi:MAG: DNA methylase [Desulfurococcales archaeon]|nr:DNA methylase [Desulfurococcales archaeon]